VRIHPDDARARGIETGQSILIFNSQGGFTAEANISEEVRPGVLDTPRWDRHSAHPYHRSEEMNEAPAVDAPAVIAGGETTEVFDSVEASLDAVTMFVD
jgi:anaerobic selenocysteine-containing dehydrogenase